MRSYAETNVTLVTSASRSGFLIGSTWKAKKFWGGYVSANTPISFYPLTFVPDSPDVVVGRKDIDSYAVFPEDGAALLQMLQSGVSPEEAAHWYFERYAEPIDIEDFLQTLGDLQFIRNGRDKEVVPPSTRSSIWQSIGRATFSPLAWIIYSAILGYSLYVMIRFPYLRPGYHNLFFSPYLVVLELGLFLGQFPGILVHELFHMLAGRRLGIPSRLGIGRRLYIIVFETHLTGLWSVPRQARYLPFLAGMLADLLWFALLTTIASLTYTPAHPFSFPGAFCLALAFSTLLRFIWQFYFYLQTDIYYVFTNILRCVDLQQTTWQYLWNRIYRLLKLTHKIRDEDAWNPRDRQVARWYVFFFGAGYLFTLGTLFFVGVPTALRIFSGIVADLLNHAAFNLNFWDSCVFLLLNGIQVAVVAWIYWRERKARRAAERSLSAMSHEKNLSPDYVEEKGVL
ncbi:conserved hypothetical protein [Ktedonobacter racemifer DSM 44963]|uniref:Uncharacterized protein n=1 Tax=Ktedonobacter racemifer DSM 44963 TaxID=485913 RepID=D6TT90_KTERA|nr:conserved hypothetical protein [Ktedonobacter racemifer DSM 44963]